MDVHNCERTPLSLDDGDCLQCSESDGNYKCTRGGNGYFQSRNERREFAGQMNENE